MSGHTPGPWVSVPIQPSFSRGGEIEIDYEARPAHWAILRRWRDDQGLRVSRPVAEVHVVGVEWDAGDANARLIAAAPDLLEALVKLVAIYDDEFGIVAPEMNAAIAAIAKATTTP